MTPNSTQSPRAQQDTALQISLFAVLFTWAIQVPAGPFDGIPLWVAIVPIILGVSAIRLPSKLTQFLRIFLYVELALISHQLFVTAFFDVTLNIRGIASGLAFSVIVALLASNITHSHNKMTLLVNPIKWFLVLQVVLMTVLAIYGSGFGSGAGYRHYFLPINRPSGLFSEPSHLAIAMAVPLVIFFGFSQFWRDNFGKLYTAAIVYIAVLCPSTTLLIIAFFILVVSALRSRRVAVAAISATITLALFLPAIVSNARHSNPIAERIYDSSQLLLSDRGSEKANLSSLVLARSIYVARKTTTDFPFGVGFDNFSFANGRYGGLYTHSYALSNGRDGASLLPRLVGEFGWTSALIICSILVGTSLTLPRTRISELALIQVSALALLIANCCRGLGYFDGGVPFIVAATVCALSYYWSRGERRNVYR